MIDFITTIIKAVTDNPWSAFTFITVTILWIFKPAIERWQKRKSNAKHYYAPKLVQRIDRYVASCVRVAYDDGNITSPPMISCKL